MPTLVIPDPCLVVLVGAAGSGKSTLARRLFAVDEILSSDAMRAVVSGDEADQRASRLAFRILHQRLEARLADGRLTVIDATNVKPEHRRPLAARARRAGVPVAAIVVDLPAREVRTQNLRRARVVDGEVVDRHLADVRRTVDNGQLANEGFGPIVILRSRTDAAELVVERRAPTAQTT